MCSARADHHLTTLPSARLVLPSLSSHTLSISFSLPSGWVLSCLRFLLFVFLLFLPLFLGTVCATQGECNAIVGRNWLSYLSHTLKVNEISASHIYIIIKTTHFRLFLKQEIKWKFEGMLIVSQYNIINVSSRFKRLVLIAIDKRSVGRFFDCSVGADHEYICTYCLKGPFVSGRSKQQCLKKILK